MEQATFAGGCFWCTEAIFTRLKGVTAVVSGYTGGTKENPSYDHVVMGNTGHAEAIHITFDPSIISYEKLLDIFWHTHNPTTRNQQGNDVGSEYRSAIFFHSPQQKEEALQSKEALEKEHTFSAPIVTEILPFTVFYPAERYHQNYFEKNIDAPYCTYMITPKIQKLLKEYGNEVKEEYKEKG